jgi:hypothetical protein
MCNQIKQENKLTVGFRCSPQTKIRLMDEANQNGVSLSEYLESLIAKIEGASLATGQPNASELQLKIETLSKRISQYETAMVKQLFQDAKLNPNNAHIKDIPDMVNAIIQSYSKTLK